MNIFLISATKLQALHTSDSKLMCKNSHIFYNSTLRGGYNAGNFTDFGKVANMSACIRLCCGDKECHAAFMLESNCYAVSCGEEDLCTPVHAKKSGALIALNPKLSYITSRSEEGKNLLRRILIDVQAIIEKSDISLIGSIILHVPE